MTIYCLYIFDRYAPLSALTFLTKPHLDRHCNCVYYHDWHRTKRPKRANEGGALLPGVSHALSPLPSSSSAAGSAPGTPFSSPRNTLASNSGVLVASNDGSQSPSGVPSSSATPPPPVQAQGGAGGVAPSAGLPFDEEAKLVYGVILSLRNMVKRLSSRYVSLPPPPWLPFEVIEPIFVSRTHRFHRAHGAGTSRLSATVRRHTSCTSSKRCRAIASSC